jgi:hypothetical protein
MDKLRANDYRAHYLLFGIIQSVPFRFKAGVASDEGEHASTLNQEEPIHD